MHPDDTSIKRLNWRHALAVAALAFVAYMPTLKVGFLWDDHMIIENNPWIQRWSMENVRHDFYSDNTQGQGDDYYRPLQAMYHRLDYSFFGLHPLGYHAAALLIHIGVCELLMLFVLTLGFTPMVALLTACLFAVHPGGIEQFLVAASVTTPLSYAFTLLCLLAALQEETLLMFGATLLFFAAAIGVKEIAIITPALVVCVYLYKGFPLRRYLVVIPMIFIAIIYLGLRHRVVHVQGTFPPSTLVLFFSKAFLRILLRYVWLILFPWNLHSHRLIPPLTHAWPLIDLAWIALTAYFITKKNKTGLFCIAWLVLNILPTVAAMIPGGFMLDHWMYQANLAVLLPMAIFFAYQWEHADEKKHRTLAMLLFPILIAWALIVHLNVQLRGTDEKLYRWALHFTTSAPVKSNLGILLVQNHRYYEAVPYLEEVHNQYPDDINTTRALAYAYASFGQRKRGYALLQELARLNPHYVLPPYDSTPKPSKNDAQMNRQPEQEP